MRVPKVRCFVGIGVWSKVLRFWRVSGGGMMIVPRKSKVKL